MVNKTQLKEFFNKVETHLKSNKNVYFSGWGSTSGFTDEDLETIQKIAEKNDSFTYNGNTYLIKFSRHTSGRGGMDEGTPDEWTVTLKKDETTFDADNFFAQKTFKIRDWLTGDERIKKMGYDTETDYPIDDLWEVSCEIFDGFGLNTMQYRLESGDVILFIDDKRFTQR